ncbi:hypothetical protein H4582DRAFT_2077918 [Lactarius indigo]|nr:hypothetical protein H4582DRAFT_2077918 [Lactarius indigo]
MPSTLLCTLRLIIKKYSASAPKGMTSSLQALAVLMHKNNAAVQHTPPVVDALAQKVSKWVETSLQKVMGEMSDIVQSSLANHITLQKAINDLGETVASLDKVASNMAKSIMEATAATSQVASTARSYKEALTNTQLNAE